MPEKTFVTFGTVHLITLAVIALIAGFYVFVARNSKMQTWVKPLSVGLAAVLLGNEFLFIIGAMVKGLWEPTWGLPLQLCDLALFGVAYSLLRHKQWIWELSYFWGLGGTLQAVLTPDIKMSFPEYYFFKFFLTHGCILIGVIFLSVGQRRPITFSSVVRTLVITNVYAVFAGVVNWVFNSNYLYLCRKPSQPSLLDHLGPWPWYIVGLEGVLIVSLLLYYLPYYFYWRGQKNKVDNKS